jgi:heat shock protein HslJ
MMNRRNNFLPVILFFILSFGVSASAQNALWLDQTPLPSWNERSRAAILQTKKIAADELKRCASVVRQPSLAADRLLARSGWTLVGPPQTMGRTSLITVAQSFDGMCRPLGFQKFVFVGSRLAGTLSPAPMDSRTDGALTSARMISENSISAEYARYRETDALCCPHKIEAVSFRLKPDGGGNFLLVPEGKSQVGVSDGAQSENLVNTKWQWLATQTPVEKIVAANPENYTLEFLPDGKVNVRADCNSGSGTYKAAERNLSFSGIVTTLRGCPPETQDRKFLDGLNAARVYRIQGDTMLIDLLADSGTMQFVRVTADGRVPDNLKNTVWRWAETITPVEKITVSNPENYTLEFLPDGKLNVQADCNRGRGSFQSNGKNLTFSGIALTRKACLQGSLSNRFLRGLEAARVYKIEGDTMLIDLFADGGTMRFTRVAQ